MTVAVAPSERILISCMGTLTRFALDVTLFCFFGSTSLS